MSTKKKKKTNTKNSGPSNSRKIIAGPNSNLTEKLRQINYTQVQDQHHHAANTKSCNRKQSLFKCAVLAPDPEIPEYKHGRQCFEILIRRKRNVNKAKSNQTQATSFTEDRKAVTQSVQREKLETQVQRKLAVNSEKNASIRHSRHSNVMTIETLTNKINQFSSEKSATNEHNTHGNVMNIKTLTNKINPSSSKNDTLRTEVGCFTKSDSVKKSATTEINVATQCDSHSKNRQNNSCGNISSISNSDVEMTWRSQRMLLEQRTHQQVMYTCMKNEMVIFRAPHQRSLHTRDLLGVNY